MIDPAKVKLEAEAEERAGRVHNALKLLEQIMANNPQDYGTLKKLLDLRGRLAEARLRAWLDEGGEFVLAGDSWLLKSIATWKQAQKRDPTAAEPYENLAQLYATQGLMVEAKQQYQILVELYKNQGRVRDVCGALCRMVEIDPDDQGIQSLLAEYYRLDGDIESAVETYLRLARNHVEGNRLSQALDVLATGLRVDPESDRIRAEMARVYRIQSSRDQE